MLQMDFEVVLYMLLSGTQPFRDSDAEALKQKIMTGQYQEMSGVRWGSISKNVKDLITQLLVVDPSGKGGSVQNEAGESGGK